MRRRLEHNYHARALEKCGRLCFRARRIDCYKLGITMRPPRIRYFLAHGIKIATIGGALSLGIPVALTLRGFGFLSVMAIVAAFPLGAVLGMLVLWPAIQVLCRFLNQPLFRVGDSVRILAGPYRDRVVQVYDAWYSRRQVRVELGEQAAKDFKDGLWEVQVCRERDT